MIGKHQDNDRGSGGKEYDNFQQVMNLFSFPPVEDNLLSTELSPVKGVNSVLTYIMGDVQQAVLCEFWIKLSKTENCSVVNSDVLLGFG